MRVEDMSAVKSCIGKPAILTVSSRPTAIPIGTPIAWAMAASRSSVACMKSYISTCCLMRYMQYQRLSIAAIDSDTKLWHVAYGFHRLLRDTTGATYSATYGLKAS